MRLLSRLLLASAVVGLTAGPLVAAPRSVTAGPHLTLPAEGASSPFGTLAQLITSGAVVFGAIRIRDTASLANKFATRAQGAQADYKDGIQTGGADWENAARSAEPAYEQGVQDAISKKRFGKGVSGSQQKYIQNATTLGPQRYAQGVANAKDAWARGVQPALDLLKGLTLPPRGPRRSPANQARANMVAQELGKLADQG
ncbi:MAG: hypothetical protein AUI15_33855 [Actinobacteria bacterium 13_2_20CM_2_66_6]|nr:MAG: hypothetical protein AUI15_33855 [Actinobacteria bacterium 13_2_20CM_2_66_6]